MKDEKEKKNENHLKLIEFKIEIWNNKGKCIWKR